MKDVSADDLVGWVRYALEVAQVSDSLQAVRVQAGFDIEVTSLAFAVDQWPSTDLDEIIVVCPNGQIIASELWDQHIHHIKLEGAR